MVSRFAPIICLGLAILSQGCAATTPSRPESARTWNKTADRIASLPETVTDKMTPSDTWLHDHPVADASFQAMKFMPLALAVTLASFCGGGIGIPSSSN